jgi:hypothetical protein
MRGVDPFPEFRQRRTTVELPPDLSIDLLSLPDLIATKKTRRDKDWPRIRRLVEVSYRGGHVDPSPEQIDFWLRDGVVPDRVNPRIACAQSTHRQVTACTRVLPNASGRS